VADDIRSKIRAGTFVPPWTTPTVATPEQPPTLSFDTFGELFIERFSKDRGKASWQDDEYMVKQLASFHVMPNCRLGDKPIEAVTEDDLEAFRRALEPSMGGCVTRAWRDRPAP
jgi:hypothetical protein